MSHPALEYAENTLGVHKVWEEAQQANLDLINATEQLIGATVKRRTFDGMIEVREMDLLIEERGKHPDHSEAAFTRHLKEVHHKDEQLARLRTERMTAAMAASGAEMTVDSLRVQVKMLSARMEQLGGYLHYLGAVKNAEVVIPPSPSA